MPDSRVLPARQRWSEELGLARTITGFHSEQHRFVPHAAEATTAPSPDVRPPSPEPPPAHGIVVVAIASAISGGVMGFLLAGSIGVAVAVFASVVVGGALGWAARGVIRGPA